MNIDVLCLNIKGIHNSKFKNILKMLQGLTNFRMGEGIPESTPKPDTSEQIYISSLALLKMLKHCRAGVPLEVMGLMLGESVD